MDNTTGPFNGGTLITVTLSAVTPRNNQSNYFVPFNWTRRVYLNDTGVTPVSTTTTDDDDGSGDGDGGGDGGDGDGGSLAAFYGLRNNLAVDGAASGRVTRVMYDGKEYDVVYPVDEAAAAASASAAAAAAEAEAFFYGFAVDDGGAVASSPEAANAAASAAQAISHNTTGCSYPTAAATMACLTSMEPYVLVTIVRAVVYTASCLRGPLTHPTPPHAVT